MSGVDTAWLRMEHPTNLMMIVGVMMFRDRIDLQKLKTTLEQRFLSYPRFKQKAVQDPAGALWETDRQFDITNHLERIKLQTKNHKAGGKQELEDLLIQMASEPLDFTKPLW